MRRIMLSLAALAAAGVAVVPAVGAVDRHSASIGETPFGKSPAGVVDRVSDPDIGSGWTTVALPAR